MTQTTKINKHAYKQAIKTRPVGCAKPKKSTTSAKKAIKNYCNTEAEYIDLLYRLKGHAEGDTLPALRLLREVLSDLQKRELELLEYEKPKLSRTEVTGKDGGELKLVVSKDDIGIL